MNQLISKQSKWWVNIVDRAVARVSVLSHANKHRLAVLLDAILCLLASWVALAIRLGFLAVDGRHFLIICTLALFFWFPIAYSRGIYRSLLRYSGGRTMAGLAVAGVILACLLSIAVSVLKIDGLPRTVSILQPIVFVGMLGASRLFIRFLLVELTGKTAGAPVRRVMIYGAGRAGQQLELSLRHETHLRVVGYLDDDNRMRHQRLDGLKVHHTDDIPELLSHLPIDEILLALPNVSRNRRKQIVEMLQKYQLAVRALPSAAKIINDEVSVSDLRPVSIEDLLGRDLVPADPQLLRETIAGRTVLVTGAGGSIGSELCRQIISIGPKCLVLFERSEIALYQIEEELRPLADSAGIEMIMELGSVTDEAVVRRMLACWAPETIFHAAAYKHVPIVERNPIAGALNNVIGTLICARQAELASVERFILISTDKAVRPTNIMGATKRICELVLQARANEVNKTCFSMVRFGNVLGSSGSVVPKFSAQIEGGGPVTLTHRDVTRYFMTIPEAAQLVIQAGAMADGGDVFVLDMGEPVKIYDLARSMIELSGLSVRDNVNLDGDIEIEEIGLRPGEKKYEELLIGANPERTKHERIIRARETFLEWSELQHHLTALEEGIREGNAERVRKTIGNLVPDFQPSKV